MEIELWWIARVRLRWLLVCFRRVVQGRSVGGQARVAAARCSILLAVRRWWSRVGHGEVYPSGRSGTAAVGVVVNLRESGWSW